MLLSDSGDFEFIIRNNTLGGPNLIRRPLREGKEIKV